MKTYEYSKNGQYLSIIGEDTCRVTDLNKKPAIDFSELVNAIKEGASKAKGKLSTGVKWTYEEATGVIKFSYRWSSNKIQTIVDGARMCIEKVIAMFKSMFVGK